MIIKKQKMKITVTGSLGNISKPLTEALVQKGHSVTVISSNPEKRKDIESLGATAAIRSIMDTRFLMTAFTGSDAAYCMIPPGKILDPNLDMPGRAHTLADNYAQVISQTGVKRVVNLSSIGAHMKQGNGILALYYDIEHTLDKLPPEVAITFMRPVSFYYNLFAFIPTIKAQGTIVSNYGGDDEKPWVSPIDIAAAVAEEITTPFSGRKIRYVASDEVSCNEVATILGTAIGKPALKWTTIPNQEMKDILTGIGMNPKTAAGFVEMNASSDSGLLYEDYYHHRPVLGKVKMVDFAKDFSAAFSRS